jgi:hypothetical protein
MIDGNKEVEQVDEGKKYAAELREIAGMLAQSPDGPIRWKQYKLGAIADWIDSASRLSNEGVREALEKISVAYDDWNPHARFAGTVLAECQEIARQALASLQPAYQKLLASEPEKE